MCGGPYHRIAGEGALQFEDFMEASSFCLYELLWCHLDYKAHSCVSVVVLVVCNQRRDFLCAIQHGLQHILFVGLNQTDNDNNVNITGLMKHPGYILLVLPTCVQDLTGSSEISMVVESMMATSPLFMNWLSITCSIVPLKPL